MFIYVAYIYIYTATSFSRGNLGEEKTLCRENKRLEFYFALDSSLNSSRGLFSVLWSLFSLVFDFVGFLLCVRLYEDFPFFLKKKTSCV
jgi:hypothetical protein